MNSVWLLPVSIALAFGLVVGGVLAWVLGRRIDPMNPPAKPSVLARTAMWMGIGSALGLFITLNAFPMIFMSMVNASPSADPGGFVVPAMIPGLLAYAATTATVVMSLTALARRDRSVATWTGLTVAGIPFVLGTAFAVAIIFFGLFGL